jgi:hypothetical protein
LLLLLLLLLLSLLSGAARLPVLSFLHENVISDGIPGVMNANEKQKKCGGLSVHDEFFG